MYGPRRSVCKTSSGVPSRNKDINILNDIHTYEDSLGGEEEHQ